MTWRSIFFTALLCGCSFVKEGSSISATGETTSETDAASTGNPDATTVAATETATGSGSTGDATESSETHGTEATASTETTDSTEATSDGTVATSDDTETSDSDAGSDSETTECACGSPGEVWPGVLCTEECVWDWSGVPQWYCNGDCSPVNDGAPWGGTGCDQADADLFCAFLTGVADATASSWEQAGALAAPGFCCPMVQGAELIGPWPELGIESICYLPGDVLETHGPGYVLRATEVICEK